VFTTITLNALAAYLLLTRHINITTHDVSARRHINCEFQSAAILLHMSISESNAFG